MEKEAAIIFELANDRSLCNKKFIDIIIEEFDVHLDSVLENTLLRYRVNLVGLEKITKQVIAARKSIVLNSNWKKLNDVTTKAQEIITGSLNNLRLCSFINRDSLDVVRQMRSLMFKNKFLQGAEPMDVDSKQVVFFDTISLACFPVYSGVVMEDVENYEKYMKNINSFSYISNGFYYTEQDPISFKQVEVGKIYIVESANLLEQSIVRVDKIDGAIIKATSYLAQCLKKRSLFKNYENLNSNFFNISELEHIIKIP